MSDTLFNAYFLKKFNNYFNRKIIGFATVAEYITAAEDYFLSAAPISFNPSDNVSTELIMNDVPFDADYLLITDLEDNIISRWYIMESVFTRKGQHIYKLRRDVIYDNLENLISSPVFVQKGWLNDSDPFIFNSEGQSYNEIKKDETLLKDETGSAYIVGYIAKNASATEISIQVGEEEIPEFISLEDIALDLGIATSKLASLINYNNSKNNAAFFTDKVKIRFGWSSGDIVPFVVKETYSFTPDFAQSASGYDESLVASWPKTLYKMNTLYLGVDTSAYQSAIMSALKGGIIANKAAAVASMETIFSRPYLTQEHLTKLQKYLGKTIKYNDKYYKLALNTSGAAEEVQGPAAYSSFGGIATGINAGAATSQFTEHATFHADGQISVIEVGTLAYLNLNDETIDSTIPAITTKIPTTRRANQNNNYDLFVIPFGTVRTSLFDTTAGLAQRVASAIAAELDAACYDVQLLPYFPMPDLVQNSAINMTNLSEDEDYSIIYQDFANYTLNRELSGSQYEINPFLINHADYKETLLDNVMNNLTFTYSITYISGQSHVVSNVINLTNTGGKLQLDAELIVDDEQYLGDISFTLTVNITSGTFKASIIFFPQSDSFRVFINQTLALKDSVKVENECNKYRLCSPNYQGSFDFNVAKNGGTVDYFIAECTYKPYTPYIKVVPQFNLLYGANYGDARGLLCGGDFSLSRFTSAWESFELQNKNYQNIFNREIQHLDFEQSLEYRKAEIAGGIGVLTGGIGGAAGGAMASGHWAGAVVGGVGGTLGSAIGMTMDLDFLARQQREAKQFSIDKFNYQLGNIKALPYTLTKVGAFNINSKIWPFLEFYTCTDEEKEALENKLKYESMTVMKIASFGDFWGKTPGELKYFKGELIRNDEIAEDNHVFEALYAEIYKGVYI